MKEERESSEMKTIMIIDDDEDDRDFFCLALRQLNKRVNVICASNGLDALELLNEVTSIVPDYIFLDLKMPRLDGKQTLVLLKKMGKLIHTNIIIYSTTRSSIEEEEVKALGAAHFLTKPIRFKDLVSSLSACFIQIGSLIHH